MNEFKYMGRVMTVITEGYEDCLAVSGILKNGKMSWEGMMWIFEPGGGRSKGVGSLLQGVIPDGVAFWGGDVGPDPLDGAGPE